MALHWLMFQRNIILCNKNGEVIDLPLGGDRRDRTDDLLNAIQALSQLSYIPNSVSTRRVIPHQIVWRKFIGFQENNQVILCIVEMGKRRLLDLTVGMALF